MKFFLILTLIVNSLAAWAYTREELERLSKDTLIDIVLDLQGGSGGAQSCTTYDLSSGQFGSILNKEVSGYHTNGTLKYPNGNVFKEISGWHTNGTIKYPDGSVFIEKSGHHTNGSVKWANGTLLREKSGWHTNNSIRHSDGSMWVEHSGWHTNGTISGLPVDSLASDGFSTKVRLLEDKDSVEAIIAVKGDGWTLKIIHNTGTGKTKVMDCF